jgi:hypothetical protein
LAAHHLRWGGGSENLHLERGTVTDEELIVAVVTLEHRREVHR